MKIILRISAYFSLSIILNALSYFLDSPFLGNFLCANIITIIITLMAINTVTSSFLVAKLQEIEEKFKYDLSEVYREIKRGLLYQIILILVAIILLIIKDSKYLKTVNNERLTIIINLLLTIIFICSLDILRDTGMSMFEIIKPHKNDKAEKR